MQHNLDLNQFSKWNNTDYSTWLWCCAPSRTIHCCI